MKERKMAKVMFFVIPLFLITLASQSLATLLITVNSPANTTYNISSIWFNITTNDTYAVSTCLYNWNGTNVTMSNTTAIANITDWANSDTVTPDGVYTVKFWCNDSNGDSNTTNVTFTVDTTPPVLSIIKPTSNYTNDTWVYVEISSNEALSNAILDWNGTEYNMTAINSTYWYYNITGLSDGKYYYNVTGYDLAGNKNTTETKDIIVDTIPPTLKVISPVNKTYATSTVDLNYSASDSNPITCYYSLDGGAYTEIVGCQNTTISSIADGAHKLTVEVKDAAGNANITDVYFSVDTTPPSVVINSPSNGAYYNYNVTEINTTVQDNINVSSVIAEVDSAYNVTLVYQGNNIYYNNTINLGEGNHTVRIYATDEVGNTNSSQTASFVIDETPPQLTIIKPTSNYTNDTWVYVEISSNEALSNAILDWNGTEYNMTAINSTYWYYNITGLSDGKYYYNVTGYDLAGNKNTTETKDIIVDTIPPTSSSYFKGSSGIVYQNDSWYNVSESSITVIINANDSLSGVKGIWYSATQTNVNRGDAVCSAVSTSNFAAGSQLTQAYSGSLDALRWVVYRPEDNAGNLGSLECIVFKQDTEAPKANWGLTHSVDMGKNHTFNITVYDPLKPGSFESGISGINTTALAPNLLTNCSNLKIVLNNKTNISYNVTNITYTLESDYPETCLLNLTNVADIAGNPLNNTTSTYVVTIRGTIIKNMTDGQGHINFTRVNAMPNLSTPYNLTIYVSIVNTTDAGVNITTLGLCDNLANNQAMLYNSTSGLFYIQCSLNRTKLESLAGTTIGEINMTVVTYALNDTSLNDSKNFTIKFDLERPKFVFNWVNITTDSGKSIIAGNPLNFTNALDAYYSPSERQINFKVKVSDNGNVSAVSVNLSNFNSFPNRGTCQGTINLTYDPASGYWVGNCTLGAFNAYDLQSYANSSVVEFNVTLSAVDSYNNPVYEEYSTTNSSQPCTGTGCTPLGTFVVLQDIGTPNMTKISPCLKTGPLTTNFSNYTQVPDMSNVNLKLDIYGNLSCILSDNNLSKNFTRVATISFSGLNFSNPYTAQKLTKLADAISIQMLKPETFGNAMIYLNTTLIKELDAQGTVSIYHLPFMSLPSIVPQNTNDTVVGTPAWSSGYDPFLGTYGGNLTFVASGFSGYDIEDNTPPAITITSPSSIVLANSTLLNVTVNGTGTPLSNITAYLDGQLLFSYNETQIKNNCKNLTADWEVVYCEKNITGLSEGQHSIKVIAYDFGGSAPGNTNTSWDNFTVAITPPEIVMISPENGGTTAGIQILSASGYVPGLELKFKVLDKAYSEVLCNVTLYHNGSTGLTVVSYDNNRKVLANQESLYLSAQTYDESHPQYYWNMTCWDNASSVDPSRIVKSETWMFYWDRTPPNETIVTQNGTRFKTSKATINVIPTDNLASQLDCAVYKSGTRISNWVYINNNTQGSIVTYDLANGAYTLDVICKDNAGNNVTRAVSVSIAKPVESSGGSSDTGVSGPLPAPKNVINLDSNKQSSFELMSGYNARFTINSENHTLKLDNIIGDKVIIEIHSQPIILELTEGQTKDVDLNGDGVYDIAVTVTKIYNAIRAQIEIQKITPSENTTTNNSTVTNNTNENTKTNETTQPAQNNNKQNENKQTNTKTPEVAKASSISGQTIAALVIIVLVIIAVGYFMKPKKKRTTKKR